MDFIAIDVETANADMSSICQIGIARYSNAEMVDEWCSLINPETYFDQMNISIHGISETDVEDSPKLPEIYKTLESYLGNAVCVSHTHFDRVSINQSLSRYELNPLDSIWLDSAKIARRTWKQFARSGYGLANICDFIGYEFKHHDALEDAKASGKIVLAAMEQTGYSIEDWLVRVKQPIASNSLSSGHAIKRDGNPEGELYGEVLCFTGSLEISRGEAADLAAGVGCAVVSGVTKKTTLLIVGDQDISKLAGNSKSSKHLRAEELILQGQNIRILKESDFRTLVGIVAS